MLYKLRLKSLFDEDGNELDYFRYDALDDDDVDLPWLQGVKLPVSPAQPFKLRIDPDVEDPADFPDYVSGPIPVVTGRFREVLDRCAVANIEYFPVTIDGAEQYEDFPTYFAMNIVGKVAAADPMSSVALEAFGPMGATLYDKLLLNRKAVEGLHVFRLAEHLTTVLVSERIKSACDQFGVDTLRFDAVDFA